MDEVESKPEGTARLTPARFDGVTSPWEMGLVRMLWAAGFNSDLAAHDISTQQPGLHFFFELELGLSIPYLLSET